MLFVRARSRKLRASGITFQSFVATRENCKTETALTTRPIKPAGTLHCSLRAPTEGEDRANRDDEAKYCRRNQQQTKLRIIAPLHDENVI
jgi:hypothetical protein